MNTQELLDSIPHDKTKEEIKIWDIDIEGWEDDVLGRIRVMAVVPRRGLPLKSIPFAVAWCNPDDFHQFKKALANKICAGRLTKFIKTDYVKSNRNCGIVPEVENLKNFVEKALYYLPHGTIPQWVNADQFVDDKLRYDVGRSAIEGGYAPQWFTIRNPREGVLETRTP